MKVCVKNAWIITVAVLLTGCAKPPEPTPERIASDLSENVPYGALCLYVVDCSTTRRDPSGPGTESFSAEGLKITSKSNGVRTVTFGVQATNASASKVFHGDVTYKQSRKGYRATTLNGTLRKPE